MFEAVFRHLNKMSYKRIYKKVRAHLLSQNMQSKFPEGPCAYKYNDLKCAVGCLIPDELYDAKMERTGIAYIVSDVKLPTFRSKFLGDLQAIHDGRGPANWEYYLNNFAITYKEVL